MSRIRGFVARVGGLFGKRHRDQELEAEFESHLRMQIEENVRRGMSAEEARRAALIQSGGIESAKESYRERRGLPLIETTLQDIRFGLRMLGKNLGVTLVAITTLALAIGVNTTVFSVVNGLLLRKPPVRDPDHVVALTSVNPAKGVWLPQLSDVSPLDFLDWRAQSTSDQGMAAADYEAFTVSGDTAPERAAGGRVSADYFDVLGVAPIWGRAFLPEEEQPGHNQVVVLSADLWQERFGRDPNVLGRTIKINGNSYTVVGVMPSTFRLPSFPAKLWVPLAFAPDELKPGSRSSRSLNVVARLKPGVEVSQARAELEGIAQRIAQAHKDTNDGWGANVMTLQHFQVALANDAPATVTLAAAVLFVLLIACTNLANLLLARNSARQREFSIRRALGAGRTRLARQLLTECLLLSVAGGAIGALVAFSGVRLLRMQFNWNEYAVAMAKEVTVDDRVLIFTLFISVLTAVLFGLVPAIQVARRDAGDRLNEGSRGSTAGPSRNRLQRLLVVGQLALSLFLLVGAGLFVEAFIAEIRVAAGFNPHNLLTASIWLSGPKYSTPQSQRQFFEAVLQRATSLPEAHSAALSTDLPFNFPGDTHFTVEGHPVAKPKDEPGSGYFAVSPGYFATTQIPLLQGREFTSSDAADAPLVVIINQAFAKHFFAGENPIRHHVHLDGRKQWSEIVGVVGNVPEFLSQPEPRAEIFVPFAQEPSDLTRVVVRTRTDPANAGDSLRGAAWAVDPDQAVTEVRTMDRVIADSASGDSLMAEMMGGFAFLALVMAAIGVFGVLSYLVGQRTHEMGIRLALGSEPRQIHGLVIRNGMLLVGIGTAMGFLASPALPKLIAGSFQGFHVQSAWVLALAPAILILVGLVACYVPARRAMRVDPMTALRYE